MDRCILDFYSNFTKMTTIATIEYTNYHCSLDNFKELKFTFMQISTSVRRLMTTIVILMPTALTRQGHSPVHVTRNFTTTHRILTNPVDSVSVGPLLFTLSSLTLSYLSSQLTQYKKLPQGIIMIGEFKSLLPHCYGRKIDLITLKYLRRKI